MTAPLLEVRAIRKHFPGVLALDGVSLSLRAGEVLAVVGENGAGKSTLMKILGGIHPPDSGEVLLEGQPVRFGSVADALARGISLIHQELNLAENLSAAANLFLGRERLWAGFFGFLDEAAMNEAAAVLLRRLGLSCPPTTLVGDLTVGQRQLVEIARALSMRARVLIMDEPTSSLTQSETDRLYEVVDQLRGEGVAVVYISHRLAEVKRLADRVVVLRDGKNAGDLARDEITHANLVRLMVGREPSAVLSETHRPEPPGADPAGSRRTSLPRGAGNGRVVYVAGRRNRRHGRTGRRREDRVGRGAVRVTTRRLRDDKARRPDRSAQRRRGRQSPLDCCWLRKTAGRTDWFSSASIQENIGLPNLDRLCFLRLVSGQREAALASEMCGRLDVRPLDVRRTVGNLSGGNQQKVVLGKWLARRPKVLILDEPTRGIDVGAKSEIYAQMDRLAREGVAILMISSDLEEVLGMSDRVLVLHEGRLAGELKRGELSEEAVMHLATGGP